MKKITLYLFICLPFVALAQSPWVAEKGKGYMQIGFTTIGPYSDLFAKDNTYSLTREVSDRTIQLYGEYGIGSSTSVLASLPFKMMETGEQLLQSTTNPNAAGSFTSLGNIQIAARHNFINKDFVLSGQLTMELPTAGYDEPTGLRGGLEALSVIPSLSVGKGFEKFYGYLSSGVAIRSNDYSSDFRLGGELGYKVLEQVYLIAVLDVVSNFENGNAVESPTQLQSGLYLNNQSFFAYGFKTIIGFNSNFGITGAFYGAGSGNLIAKSPSLNVGAYYKW